MASAAPSSDPSQGAGSGPEGNPQGNGNYTNGTGIASQSPNAGSEAANGVAAASAAKYEEKSASSPTNGHSAPPAASKAPMERSPSTSGLPPGAKIDPELKYGFVSGWLFSWVTPLVARCRKGPISLREVHKLPKRMETATCIELFGKFWREELAKVGPEKASPAKALLRAFFWPLALAQVTLIMANAFGMLGPCYFMYNLSQFAADPSMSVGYGIGMAFGFMANNQMMSFFMHKYWIMVSDISSCARSAMIGVIYNKAIALRDLTGLTVGELLNMCTNDSQRVFDAGNFLLFIPASLIFSCAILIYTALLVGPGAILGWAVFMLILPFQAWVARMSAQWRRGALQFTDRRVRLMSEILACIKLIKMYAWELAFSRHVGELRVKERAILQKAAYLQSFVLSLIPVVPVLAGVATFILSGYLNNHLVAADAFTIMALYNALRFIMATVPNAAKSGAEAQVGLKRIKTFLLTEGDIVKFPEPAAADVAIDLQNSVFAWRALSEHKTAEANRQAALGAHTDVAVPLDKAVATAAATAAAVTDTNGAPATSAASAAGSAQGTPSRGASVGGIDGGESETDEVTTDSSLRPQRLPSRRGSASVQVQAPLPPRISEETDVDEAIAKKQALAAEGKIKDIVVLEGINLTVPRGTLVGVCGAVGSGKSSLISAILSQMKVVSGTNHVVRSIAYVAQQAWIQSATLRNNVLFGLPYDEAKYNRVIDICCLRPDLDVLPAGDATEIGERGINLSGGQKQRVSLARAVYQEADCYFLDDPLSAVDAHVGKHIFEHVIGPRGLLQAKTRILVTHGIHFLPQTDQVVVLREGRISENGSYTYLLAQNGDFARFIAEHSREEEDDAAKAGAGTQGGEGAKGDGVAVEGVTTTSSSTDPAPPTTGGASKAGPSTTASAGTTGPPLRSVSQDRSSRDSTVTQRPTPGKDEKGKLIMKEAVSEGDVKRQVYMNYFRANGYGLCLLILALYLVAYGLQIGSNVWLSLWSSDKNADEKIGMYLGGYAGLGIGNSVGILVVTLLSSATAVAASRTLHARMMLAVLRSPMTFFDTTPLGRIVNRFSKDIYAVDETIPRSLRSFLTTFLQVVSIIVVISYSTPIFMAAILPLGLLYYWIQRYYVATSRQLQRLESVSRSPIYALFSETLNGVTSIRAYGRQRQFIDLNEQKLDTNMRAYYPSICANRWLALRLEFLGNCIIFFAALFAVIERRSISPEVVGLSLSYAMSVTQTLNWMVRMSSQLESDIVAVERVEEYIALPSEAPRIRDHRPAADWPHEGQISIDQLGLRYRPELDLVLRGLTCNIRGGEKVGIVGRTGAGKSSLTLSLFRLIEPSSGRIVIDGENIGQLGLQDLRSRLTVMPQDPVLFCGSVRDNLDPFHDYDDAHIWSALETCNLRDFVTSLGGGLEGRVAEGGENFSVGQRQLLCLARAVLRRTKVLVLDEATAAVDLETDQLIQRTIRSVFRQCTVLTIAHRINTILDCDRVMVLDKGAIVEFDSPANLLAVPNGIFRGMAAAAGVAAARS
eukprot:m.61104 g.61104  ORF g.61104 m.61104 type:complete len:1523 (-) comp12327_c0_seq3:30-4598(-)